MRKTTKKKTNKKNISKSNEEFKLSTEESEKQFEMLNKHSTDCMGLLHKRFFDENLPDSEKARLGVKCMALTSAKYVSLIASFIKGSEYGKAIEMVNDNFKEQYDFLVNMFKENFVNSSNNNAVN